jgi:hypothetical protein
VCDDLFNVFIPLAMPAAGWIVICEAVDQAHSRMTPKDRLNIHHGDPADDVGRNHFETANDLCDIVRDLRLERSDDNVLAAAVPPAPFVEQCERLADARRISKEDLQLAALCGARLGLDLA